MDCSGRKVSARAIENERRFDDIVRVNIVRDIHNPDIWSNAQDHTFHDPGKGIDEAEVGC
jgi:hypothetical protein